MDGLSYTRSTLDNYNLSAIKAKLLQSEIDYAEHQRYQLLFCISKSFQLNLKFIYNKNNRTMYMDTSKRYFFNSEMVF